MTDIAIINQSTVVTDAGIAVMVPALQTQISRDFAPVWGVDATLIPPTDQPLPPSIWMFYIMDDSDQSGDLGYHLDDTGTPSAKVFAKADLEYGVSLSTTISHELLEMLADPQTNREFQEGAYTYIVEVCDPVESDEDGYDIDGIRVSNFAMPRYFGLSNPLDSQGVADPRYDFRAMLEAPIPTLRPGGYCMYQANGQWQSIMARKADGSLGYRALRQRGRSRFRASEQPK